MSDYRDYYNEEEQPATNPAAKWIIIGLVGLLIGGLIGFAVGAGSNINGGLAPGGSKTYLILTIIIAVAVMGIAVAVKRSVMGTSGMVAQQSIAVRLVVLGLGLALLLAFGVYFMLAQ